MWNLEILDEVFDNLQEYVAIFDLKTYKGLYANKNLLDYLKVDNINEEEFNKIFKSNIKLDVLHKETIQDKVKSGICEYIITNTGKKVNGNYKIIKWIDNSDCILLQGNAVKDKIADSEQVIKIEKFEKMIKDILKSFNDQEDFDKAMQMSLQLIGEFYNSDRSYIFSIDSIGKVIYNTYEWCNNGILSVIGNLQQIPYNDIPWWINKIENSENIIVDDTHNMPLEASKENIILKNQSIKSLAVIPFKIFNQLYGFLGIDIINETHAWSKSEVEILESISKLIGEMIEKYSVKSYCNNYEKYMMIFEAASNPTVILNRYGNILFYNNEFIKFIGAESSIDVRGMRIKKYFYNLDKFILKNKEIIVNTGFGEKHVIASCKHIESTNQYVISLVDITKLKCKEKRLQELSYTDELTKVNNRNKYIHDLEILEKESLESIGLLLCDIDELKFINDSIGHEYGDMLIRSFANILKDTVENDGSIYRIGGDEFVIIFKNIYKEDLNKIYINIKKAIRKENGRIKEYLISASLGLSFQLCNNTIDVKALIKEADCNMYNEKVMKNRNIRNEILNGFTEALEMKDYGISQHGLRLEKLSIAMAEKMNLDKNVQERICILAKFHDIGKIGIEDKILFKPDVLTDTEYDVVKKHSEIGCRIARNSAVLSEVSDLILKHHERYDGDGYPIGLKEDEIPIECRILAIVDTYDVITNERHYKKALSKVYALEEIKRCSGTQFDPRLVEIFLEIMKNK